MKIIFISVCEPHHRYLIAEVAKRWEVTAVIRPVWRQQARSSLYSRLRTLCAAPRKALAAKVRGRYYAMYYARLRRRISRLLGDSPLPCPVHEIPRSSINDAATVQLIKKLEPDVLLLVAAPILKPNVYSLAKQAAINIHYGIAPHYRGDHGLFWPLRLDDFSNIGLTVHHVAAKADAGTILAQYYPPLEQGDDEASLSAKCTKGAVDVLQCVLEKIEGGSARPASLPPGRLAPCIRFSDRWVRHDLAYLLRRLSRLHRVPSRPARVDAYY